MSFAIWALIVGAILIAMALLGTLVERLPLSPGMLYLAIGYALGPAALAIMTPDPELYSVAGARPPRPPRVFGAGGWRWLAVDVFWAIAGGVAIGGALGALVGKVVLYLRTRHRGALGLDEFLSLGLIAVAYGIAQLCVASGFLAVFALNHGLPEPLAHELIAITLTTVAASIILHGISVTPLMRRYTSRKAKRSR